MGASRRIHHHYHESIVKLSVMGMSSMTTSRRTRLASSCLEHQRHQPLVVAHINATVRLCSSSSSSSSSSNKGDDKKNNSVITKTKTDNEVSVSASTKVITTLQSIAAGTIDVIRNPARTWHEIKEVAHHYWVGSKLLWSEMKMTYQILKRLFEGHGMTRRERKQLVRTSMDMFRLIPFSIFVIVPFMEFLLPFALRLFPNMLPSTFQDSLKKEENMKKDLQMRLAIAGFMQETLQEMAELKNREAHAQSSDTSGAAEVIEFIEKAKLGEPLPNESVIRIARLFKDELTLANISRPQLVTMCRYMNLQPYGADAILRFQLRTKLRSLKEDDRRILWEGINTLTTEELREACQERGMRSIGLTSFGYKRQLQEWLDLSIQKNIPISLLIMSRAFSLSSMAAKPEEILKSSMSSLDADTINEVVLAVALPAEEKTLDIKTRKLESIQFQKEMIEDEREDKEEVEKSRKVKDSKDKEESLQLPSSSSSSSSSSSRAVPSKEIKIETTTREDKGTKAAGDERRPVKVSEVATEADKVDDDPLKLTVAEVQALGDFTRGSSVEREKAELAILEASVKAVIDEEEHSREKAAKIEVAKADTNEAATSAATHTVSVTEATKSDKDKPDKDTVAKKEDSSKEDKSIDRMKNALSNMLDKLKLKIDTTEKELGNKLHLLDKDNDGELSIDEIKSVISKHLKRNLTDAETDDIVKILDTDMDGKITVLELLQYIESRRVKIEVEVLEERLSSSNSNSNNNNNSSSSSSSGGGKL